MNQPEVIHRALQIEEILGGVCTYLETRHPTDLLRLALTCRWFTPTALNYLWGSQMSYLQVFHPLIVWGILRKVSLEALGRPTDYYRFTLVQVREITPAELDNYRNEYARRVRSITWDPRWSAMLPEETMASLAQLLAAPPSPDTSTAQQLRIPLFPRITRLQGRFTELSQLGNIQDLFVNGSLRELLIKDTALDQGTSAFLNSTSPILTQLHTLSLHVSQNDFHSIELVAAIKRMLEANQDLRRLEVNAPLPVLYDMYHEPIQHHTLKELTLVAPEEGESWVASEVHLSQLNCPSLESARFLLPYNRLEIGRILPGPLPHLKNVRVITEARLNGNDTVLPFFRDLAECGSSKFESLYLKSTAVRPSNQPEMEQIAISSHHLHRLTVQPLAGLLTIHIVGYVHTDITNDELLLLGSSSPRLTKLYIGPEIESPPGQYDLHPFPEPKINLAGLIYFARILPNLLELRLSVQARPMDINPTIGLVGPSRLRKWDVCTSSIFRPEIVASMLLQHFPNLEKIIMQPLTATWPLLHPLEDPDFADRPSVKDLRDRITGFRIVRDTIAEAFRARREGAM